MSKGEIPHGQEDIEVWRYRKHEFRENCAYIVLEWMKE
jgi:hypothetical protein